MTQSPVASLHVVDVDETTFETAVVERSQGVPVLVDFWAEWCDHLFSYWYRPWSRELHYWVLDRLFGAREPAFHLASFALWVALMTLYYGLARRLVGGRGAAIACAAIAGLAAWSGALGWVAGVQELWLLFWAFAFLHLFARRRTLSGVRVGFPGRAAGTAACGPACRGAP